MTKDKNEQKPAAAQPKRHTAGVVVVVFLGLVFFVLVGLLIFSSGHRRGASPVQSETLTVVPPRIRLRTEPNAKAAVVVTATAGEELVMFEDRQEWVRVQDPDGLTGWAERALLERTSERERRIARIAAIRKLPALNGTATNRTALYSGPGIFYAIVGELSEGASVKVFTRDHDFYALDFNGEVAYADIDAIDVTATGAPQLDVATTTGLSTAPATGTTASVAPPQPETPAEGEPPAPQPEPVPALADRSGVYAAVPPGGTQPEEIDRVVPRYPTAARMAGASGAVVIRGVVRRDGRIDNVEIIRDLPYGLGDAAREAVRQWRFRPAMFRGEPIDVYYTVTVNFRLR
jgi:TonB family protein